MSTMMKRIFWGILAAMTCLSVHAQQEKLIFTPQWTAQAQFAGYYVAQEMGFYYKAGIDVEIVHPSVTQSAISRIRNNESQATTLQPWRSSTMEYLWSIFSRLQ